MVDTQIEETLSQFEGRADPVYDALLAGNIPNPSTEANERMYFSQFVALMIARTPATRRMHAEVIGKGIQTRNYAYAVNDEAFESLIHRVERETGLKLDELVKHSKPPSPKSFHCSLLKPWILLIHIWNPLRPTLRNYPSSPASTY